MSNEPARPIDISNIMSHRGLSLLNSVRLTFELIENHKKVSQLEYATITAAIANHLRSCDPMASQIVQSIEMPVVSSPAISPVVEPRTRIERDLHDGAKYRLESRGIDTDLAADGTPVIAFRLEDSFGDNAGVALTDDLAEQLQADIAAVRAAVRR